MCPDRFPEAFARYKGPIINLKSKGITTFDELLDSFNQWAKAPKSGLTFKQLKALSVEARKENLKNIYITQEGFKNGKHYKVYRNPMTGAFVSPENPEVSYKRAGNWFDGKYWRTPGGHFAKKPLKNNKT